MAQFGSVQNQYGIGPADAPEVGMGATIVQWSDRHAATIVEVGKGGKRIVVQRDKATRTDSNGMSESQSYEFERDPDGATEAFTLRRDGYFVAEGSPMRDGTRCWIGVRSHYHDYSF